MRRISWVRVSWERGRYRARAIGLGHRLPTEQLIPMEMAADLAARGVPVVIRRRSA